MKTFKGAISLVKNARGCYILDTVKGCSITKVLPRGCYHDCYAKSIASRYKLDFETPVKREFKTETYQPSLFGFEDSKHLGQVWKQIKTARTKFIRIGEMGDPSQDWKHTLDVIEKIKTAGKKIVVITKHWNAVPNNLIPKLDGICINTSVSALDTNEELTNRLGQYERLKPFCKSVLRVVTCDFNETTDEGAERNRTQNYLLRKERVLETVFRPGKYNPFLVNGIINARPEKFLKKEVMASKRDKSIYMGNCKNCIEQCGINL
jgi:hypothetical protein